MHLSICPVMEGHVQNNPKLSQRKVIQTALPSLEQVVFMRDLIDVRDLYFYIIAGLWQKLRSPT
ncbi:MAG: hypothetical protein KME15_06375 [Drouetiella hepatica Uher 2000/2452]|uniref:Uncharacterized protein n=1 Tax=Drouetiella hepatica Uher 2000/2452 TaxID=904376 RepID=A0A951UL34_9CYAN|nr:hypothetical protein [Drouetiella hepatica Uher 2000/2452]